MGRSDRKQTTRVKQRQLRNMSFTVVMLVQLLFWTYVFVGPRTKASGYRVDDVNTQLVKANPNPPADSIGVESSVFFNPSKMINLLASPNREAMEQFIKKTEQREQPKPGPPEVAKQPLGGYLDDVLKVEMEAEHENSLEQDFNKYFNPLLHHTMLPRDASVIWNASFLRNPASICRRHSDLDLLLVVHTAPYNFRRRAMLRYHILNQRHTLPYTVQPVFMLGQVKGYKKNVTMETMLDVEFEQYGDLVQMDFAEDFRNLSLKAVMWLRWTNEFCRNPRMVLKIDDDVVLDVQKILPLTSGLFTRYNRSIFCHLNKIGGQPIPRTGRTKVDPREFMRMAFYPYNYCSGFIVFLTPDLLPLLERTARRIPFYNVDDVFLFGMVPKLTGHVTYHNIGYNVSIWHRKVLTCQEEKGSQCPYFGTMGEEEEARGRIWDVVEKNHAHDFHFPQLHIK